MLAGEDRDAQPDAPSRKRKRGHRSRPVEQVTPPTSDLNDDDNDNAGGGKNVKTAHTTSETEALEFRRQKESNVEEETRRTNAYPGATNSINSIHQRRWFLSLDRMASGFIPEPSPLGYSERGGNGRKRWIRKREKGTGELLGFEPFHVLGREAERSVVTGRLAADVLRDEGVEGYVARKGWRGITE